MSTGDHTFQKDIRAAVFHSHRPHDWSAHDGHCGKSYCKPCRIHLYWRDRRDCDTFDHISDVDRVWRRP